MSILGKYTDNYIEDEPVVDDNSYTTPAVLRDDEGDMTLKKSILISSILHPSVLGGAWLVFLILALLGINLALFERPKPKMNDIEFVLVDHEATPINKNTKNRADMNSRSGGINDPKKPLSMPSPAPAKAQKPSPSQTSSPVKSSKPAQAPKAQQPVKQQTAAPAAPAKTPAQAKPQPPTARPSLKPPTTPKTVQKPSSAFQIPVPSGGTKAGQYSTGPISGSGKAPTGGSGTYAPTPSLAPTGGGSTSGTKLASGGGGGGGTGNIGNPGGGGGRPGIDAIREPDFGPYMKELQRRIKMNWDPPKGNESKRVVLLFKIAKDGRLLSCSVFKSSGLPNADNAALNAVKLTAPFKPLPVEFKGQSIDIQFTFDYNVFGASSYR